MGLSVFIYYMAIEQYKVAFEQLHSFQDTPFDGPPWYSIHSAFLKGICFGEALLITLLLSLAIVRWFPETSLVLATFGLIWLGGHVWGSVVIMVSCTDFMDPVKATTRWHTFDEFLYDPFILFGNFILPFLWLLLFYPLSSQILKRLDCRQRITDRHALPVSADII
jgi:hypothetical protein